MANMIDEDEDRLIDAEDSSADDEQQQEEEEQTLSLPSVVGSGRRKIKKSEMKRNKLVSIQPGLIRLSGLPYGFFERELYSYFCQFGTVTRLKLIRSKKTGGSRGYAYIEFEDEDVARIASETMNGYLMFRSLIKSRVMDRNRIDIEKLFKNWKRLFTVKTPKQKRALYNRPKSDEQIDKTNQRRKKKLLKQQEKLAAAGIKYELTDFIPMKATKKDTEKKSQLSEKKNEKTTNKVSKYELYLNHNNGQQSQHHFATLAHPPHHHHPQIAPPTITQARPSSRSQLLNTSPYEFVYNAKSVPVNNNNQCLIPYDNEHRLIQPACSAQRLIDKETNAGLLNKHISQQQYQSNPNLRHSNQIQYTTINNRNQTFDNPKRTYNNDSHVINGNEHHIDDEHQPTNFIQATSERQSFGDRNLSTAPLLINLSRKYSTNSKWFHH